jgi:hypothetical protein
MVSERERGSTERVRDASLDPGTQPSGLDDQNPWPGMAAYDEASSGFFHGRKRETDELVRLIRLAPLTALYGKSGLGKSSLLQAGLFPLLRAQHYLPVYLRIDFSEAAADPLEQAAVRLEQELARAGAEYPQRSTGEILWEYLHREPLEIWSKDNFPLIPVLVFDQFEELFSHGPNDADRVQKVSDSLADLIENRIPAGLATDAAKTKRSRLNLLSQNYRIVLSFREDYLPDIKSWERDAPSLLRNFLRLEPMTRQCAIETVEGSGRTVLADGVAPLIVDFVGKIDQGANKNTEAIIEPVLLCLCCYQLNRRREDGERISKTLVERTGRDILDSFYRTALGDDDVKGPPDAATFIETFLVQGDRFRGAYPKAEAIDGNLLKQAQVDALTDRHRLLRVVQHSDTARLELIHDRLVEVVCKARDERKLGERRAGQERQAAQARIKRNKMVGALGALVMLFVMGGTFVWQFYALPNTSKSWIRRIKEATSSESQANNLWLLATFQPWVPPYDLSGIPNLANIRLPRLRLYAPNFSFVSFTKVALPNAQLPSAALNNSVIDASDFSGSNLQLTQYRDARISATSFAGADLYRAVFDRALLCDVNFSNADLANASFWGATLDDRTYGWLRKTAWWIATGWNSGQLEKLHNFSPVGPAETRAIRQALRNSERFHTDFEVPVAETRPGTFDRAIALNDMAWTLATWGIDADSVQTTSAPCDTAANPKDALVAATEAVCIIEDLKHKAIKDIDHDNWLANFRDTQAYILMQADRMSEARVLYEKDIERTEADGGTLFRYGVVLYALGDEKEADIRFKAALEKQYLPSTELQNLRQYIPLRVMAMVYELIDRTYPVLNLARSCAAETKPG